MSSIPNQVFIGLPLKIAPKYESLIADLKKKFPIHFTIVGSKKDKKDADDLLEVIKHRIESSSYGIFDATSGNANVSLEYGYAEGIGINRQIFLSKHKASNQGGNYAMIANLIGKRRVEYKNEKSLKAHLEVFCREHTYTKRFEKFLSQKFRSKKKGEKKTARTLALKIIHFLDDEESMRRTDLMQFLQSEDYKKAEADDMITKLNTEGLIKVPRGRHTKVRIV